MDTRLNSLYLCLSGSSLPTVQEAPSSILSSALGFFPNGESFYGTSNVQTACFCVLVSFVHVLP